MGQLMARAVPEWQGRTDDAMPGIHVLMRLYAKQDGLCACGCGRVMNFDRDQIHCDHKTPLRDGGENRESNLQLMLAEHHLDKTVAENVARGKERRHKSKAFPQLKARKRKWNSRPLGRGNQQHTATRPIRKRSEEKTDAD